MDELTGVEVIDNPERRRFEARKGRKVLGWASYEQTSELIVFTHTRVDRRWEGLGLGGRLVRETLDYVRSQGMHVLSTCPFVTDWINRRPDYQDLVYRPETRAS